MSWNSPDADRWQCASDSVKVLIPSPHSPLQMMHKAGNKYQVGKASDKEEAKQRQLKGILNKLMHQNFAKLLEQVEEVTIDNVATLAGFVSQIFDKALREPTFCEMYANFCFHLAGELPDFVGEDNEKITFKRLLLNKCQEEFERGEREQAEADGVEEDGEVKRSEEEREEKRIQARRRMLGNIRLIGELYKNKMLTERIMHECIKKLLGQDQNPDEEDVEALCKLMSTIGENIDHPKAKKHMDAYFERMQKLSNNQMLSSRVRFMLKDVIDLRKNRWQQRRKIERPKMIKEVHRDAAQWRMAQSSSDADWWQRALDYVKDLIPTLYSPYPIMHKDGKEHEVGRISEEEDAPQRKLTGIVWKQTHKRNQLKGILKTLTPLNFDKILKQVKAVNLVNLCTLVDFISQIFDEALREPIFCEMYANFCYNVAGEFHEFYSKDKKKINFRRLLVRKCWEEFERSEREKAEANRVEEDGAVKSSEEEREEKMVQARRRMLGSIQLIAELYKKRMLPNKIMHASIQNLLGQDQNPDEEDVEALCKLMSTVGEIIDHPRAMKLMDVYFERMQKLSNNQKMSSRVMFMLKDTIDLRNNRWQQMRKFEDPKKIEEVHRDAAQGGMARNSPDADKWASGSQKGCTPPHFPLQMMHKAWKKSEVGMVSDEEEAKQRQLKGILNKLVPQNLDTFLEQVEEVNIDNVVTLADFVSQIFDRALREPIFCEMYVNFCFHLADELPTFIGEDNKRITFRSLLLNKCWMEFERRKRKQAEADRVEPEGEVRCFEEEIEEIQAHRRMLGNIQLIGELYKKDMLAWRIIASCINKLLDQYQDPDEEDVEALCKLMSMIGEVFDLRLANKRTDAYFEKMQNMSNNQKLSYRVRFMLKDTIDLRLDGSEGGELMEGPMKIEEREERSRSRESE